MVGMRWLAFVFILGSMGLVISSGRDRTIDIANSLVAKNQLRALDSTEETNLRRFITALMTSEKADIEIAINQRHQAGRLNIYVVDATVGEGGQIVSRGNAAYVLSSDTLFVESLYFEFGSTKTFVKSTDELTEKVLSALRVQAYFVLAHEIGHRQLRHGREWFGWKGEKRSYIRETAADDFAVSALKTLYASPESRASAGIPEPISTSFFDEPGPLERIADHLGYAVAFLSDEIFDNPFPILANSSTHPAFLGRMLALLQRLKLDAEAERNEQALERLRLAEIVVLASDALLASGPIEIEYSNPFQYAYLTTDAVFVVGNDGSPIAETSLSGLVPGKLYRRSLPKPQRNATVRYAWPGAPGDTFVLRRDGRLETIENNTGQTLSTFDLSGMLGDNSCVKQFLLPPHPQRYVLATSCVEGRPQVTTIDVDGSIRTVPLSDLALAASRANGDGAIRAGDIDVRGFNLSASGRTSLVFIANGAVHFTSISEALEPSPARKLLLRPEDIPAPISINGARALPRTIVTNGSDQPFFAYGTPIFRDIAIFDAEVRSDVPIASVDLSPSIDEDRLSTILPLVTTIPVGQDRVIINLGTEGAYLMNFAERSLLPIRRSGFGALEQIVANANGDWIYYRKYGSRIIVFRGEVGDVE